MKHRLTAWLLACVLTLGLMVPAAALPTEDAVEETDELVLLDTIPVEGEKAIDKIETLSVADLFAEAIRRIYDETAISDLYN